MKKFIPFSKLKPGTLVDDIQWQWWRYGTVVKKYKTTVHINFPYIGTKIYDKAHAELLLKRP